MSDSDQIFFDTIDKMECPACRAEVDISALVPFSMAACPNCGSALTVPAKLSNYRLLECLGRGGMGSVYRAYDETLDRIVAIKVMLKKLGEEPEFLDSFRREAQAAAKLNHPNIAQIYSFGQEKGQPYIVMELVPGKHLDKLIEAPAPLPLPMIMRIGMNIADGLQLAAASNLIHGDIKPENILLDDRDMAKLVDFGIASSPDADSTEIWGTPYYISPEKIKRERVDFRSDMYCLGGTLYHAITKHPPFDGKDAMEVVKARLLAPPKPLREYRPDVDKEVEEIIMRMLQLDPAMRYPTYGSLMSDIRQYLARVQPSEVAASSGGASKKIIIKGRSGATRSRLQAATGLQPSVTGSLQAPMTTTASMTGNLNKTGTQKGIRISKTQKGLSTSGLINSSYSQQITPPEDLPPPQDDERKKKSKIIKIVVISVVSFVVLIIAAVLGILLVKQNNKKQADSEIASMINSQAKTLIDITQIYNNTLKCKNETILDATKKADEIVQKAIKLVEDEVGTDWTEKITYEQVRESEPFDDTIEGDLRGVGKATSDEGEETEEDAPEAPTDGTEEAAEGDGEEAPAEGEAAPAKSEGEGNEESSDESPQEEAEEAPTEDAAAEETAPSEENGEEVAEEIILEGLPGIAREIFVMLAPVREAGRLSDRVFVSVSSLYSRATTSTNIVENAGVDRKNDVSEQVEENKELIAKITEKASQRYGDLEDATKDLRKILRDAETKLGELSVEATRMATERERLAAEAKAQEEARKAREKKEAEEAARKAAENAEIQKVKAVMPAAYDKLIAHQYDSVIRELNALEPKLTFKSAKSALKVELRRVQGLKDLKAFLVKHLSSENKFVHPRIGWTVVSADDRKLEIRGAKKGATSKKIKWEELKPLEQIVPMIQFYLADPEKAKDIPLRERTSNLINAAIYYVTFASDNEFALKTAKTFCDRVIDDMSSKKKEVIETLYELEFPQE